MLFLAWPSAWYSFAMIPSMPGDDVFNRRVWNGTTLANSIKLSTLLMSICVYSGVWHTYCIILFTMNSQCLKFANTLNASALNLSTVSWDTSAVAGLTKAYLRS